jgi:ribonuclease G
MSDQLIVNVTGYETRVALLEGGLVTELLIERNRDRGIVGNIYLGKVQRVLPGMQAAFVEIGLDKAAFLYVGDVVPPEAPDNEEDVFGADKTTEMTVPSAAVNTSPNTISGDGDAEGGKGEKRGRERRRRRERPKHRIEQLLKPGQQVLVQVTKDAIGTKGPRVTCNVTLPGRHIVFMPTYDHVGISRKITDEEERTRLRTLLSENKPTGGGFVARTVSAGVDDAQLMADIEFLVSTWQDIEKRRKHLQAPCLAQPELDLMLKCARDFLSENIDRMIIDDPEALDRTRKFVGMLDPALSDKLEGHEHPDPIFDHYGVESEIARAMSRKVWLKSGGSLIIDQAEALTAIDVNTGRFVGKRNLEDTILRTNLEAVREVAYQLRLRNIGGMVIIDFIDMEEMSHREKVLSALLDALKKDRARCNVVKISELGLVEMTRQRTRESLGRQLCESCFYCEGRGTLKSKLTVVYEIFRALERQAPLLSESFIVVHAHPEVADVIFDEEAGNLAAVEARTGKEIVVKPRGSFHQEQFDIYGTTTGKERRTGDDRRSTAEA